MSGGASSAAATDKPRRYASMASESPNAQPAVWVATRARASQKFCPGSDVIPVRFLSPSQSITKLIQAPSGSCIQSTKSKSPRAHRSTHAGASASSVHRTVKSLAVSSTHATPSNPDSSACTTPVGCS